MSHRYACRRSGEPGSVSSMQPTVRPSHVNRWPIHCESRRARQLLTVTRWAPRPASAFRYSGSVATTALPSPVAVAAIRPRCSPTQPLLGVGAVVLGAPQPVDLRRERTRALRDTGAERGRLGPEVGVGQILEPRFVAVDRVDQRLDPLELTLEARADELGDELFEHQ